MSSAKVLNFTQPESFSFTEENLKKIDSIIKKYPAGRKQSAVLPLLYLAQEQHDNWVPKVAMDEIAKILEIPSMKVYEVATFYTMFNLQPVGKFHLQVCTTTPCWLRGSDDLLKVCKSELGIGHGETSSDKLFTLTEVECLGACANAPMIQVNNHEYYEDLNAENFEKLLNELRTDKAKPGSQIGRKCSEPIAG